MMSTNSQNIIKGSTSRVKEINGRHNRTRFASPIPELEILKFETGDSSNLIIQTKKLQKYAIRTFGRLGQIFETGNYWAPDETEETAPNAFEYERKIYIRLLEEREKSFAVSSDFIEHKGNRIDSRRRQVISADTFIGDYVSSYKRPLQIQLST